MLPAGMFSTLGNQIVDQKQTPVRLTCVYWDGMNGDDNTLGNLNGPFVGIQANMNAIAAAGFNCLRVDFNNISLHDNGSAAFLQAMDNVVAAATQSGIRVIFDDHNNEGNYGSNDNYTDDCAAQQANGIWYDLGGASNGTDGCNDIGHTTQASFQSDWVSVATRYTNNDTVIGYDLWNEPLSYGDSLWGGGSDRDIHLMYETVGSAILSVDPSKLIFVECPQNYSDTTLFDGTTVGVAPFGDCTGVKALPVVFTVNGANVTNKTVYDVHLYPDSISDIAHLFGGSSSSPAAIAAMNTSFGFLESQNIAPVWDGESGTGLQVEPDDRNWANMLDQYLNGQLGSQGGPTFSGNQQGMGIAWTAWGTTNPTSTTEYLGILNTDGSLIPAQVSIVDPLLYYPAATPTISIRGTEVTVTRGAATGNTSTITVTPAGGFTGSVRLTAALTSSPANAMDPPTFSFGTTSPVSITGASAGTATLTIYTTAALSGSLVRPVRPRAPWYATGGVTLACILFVCIPARQRGWRTILGMVVLLAALTGCVVACGGGGGGTGNLGTTAGAYTITVTATSSAATATGTVTLNVQ
jgi:aryl-phospho-beta-D-glucosidase BglC (GH1 family)